MDSDPPVFLAQDVGSTIGEDRRHHPTVVIDVSNNPEVADLPRVHAIDGIGDVSTAAIRTGDAVVLGVQLTRPVTAAFAVVFDLRLHEDFLNEVANANSLTFATTSPADASLDQPLWLSVDIDGDLLREALANSVEPDELQVGECFLATGVDDLVELARYVCSDGNRFIFSEELFNGKLGSDF